MAKPEHEFFDVATLGFTRCVGDVDGLSERILTTDPVSGATTGMLRFEPGCDTSPNGVLAHDFWEEVYVVSGSITDLRLGETFPAGSYACRPPGMPHGPWSSAEGCVTFEVSYPADRMTVS